MSIRRVLFFVILVLVSTSTRSVSVAQTLPDFLGTWKGSFTNQQGSTFAQTMIIEEQKGDEFRGRYIGYSGNEILGGVRGRTKLSKVTITLSGTDFDLVLKGKDRLEGFTWRAPGEGAAGTFLFVRVN